MQNFIESRDIRWRHVGGGSTDKILDRYLTASFVDEDELLGLGEYFVVSSFFYYYYVLMHSSNFLKPFPIS